MKRAAVMSASMCMMNAMTRSLAEGQTRAALLNSVAAGLTSGLGPMGICHACIKLTLPACLASAAKEEAEAAKTSDNMEGGKSMEGGKRPESKGPPAKRQKRGAQK